MAGIKKNFIYSALLTSANYVFPLIVWPYVSRVLGVENVGLVNFTDSLANYAILLSMLGLTVLGIREIAVTKSDPRKMSAAFRDMLFLNFLFTILAIAALALATLFVDQLRQHWQLMVVAMVKVAFNLLLIEWFYKGLEDFRYITIRTVLVRCLYVAGVFIFVRSHDDYTQFYLLTVGVVVVNALINTVHARRYLVRPDAPLRPGRYLRPFLTLGVYMLLTAAYTTLNVALLGFLTNDTQVGYYATATKIFAIILSVYTAFTTVMLPRMSSLLAENRIDDFKAYIGKSQRVLMALSIPVILFSDILAPQIVMLIAGPGYEGAITPMRIIMPFILMLGYEQTLVQQILMPLGKDRVITLNSLAGAIFCLTLNFLIVPRLQAVGSAILWTASEFLIFILAYVAVNREMRVRIAFGALLRKALLYIPLALFLIFWPKACPGVPYWLVLIVAGIVTGGYFLALELGVEKDPDLRRLVGKILRRK